MTPTAEPNALIQGLHFKSRRTADGIVLEFPVLRAPGPATGLAAFALLCGLMPAVGLAALLPINTQSATAMVSLALIGGFAAPFILASVVFAALAVYLMSNALRVTISSTDIHTERRLFGRVVQRRTLARADAMDVEPRIASRYQNVFSATPRYALVACNRNHEGGSKDVTVAEDIVGQALMQDLRALICATLQIKIPV